MSLDFAEVARRFVVCREPRPRQTADGITILPVGDFVERLWSGALA